MQTTDANMKPERKLYPHHVTMNCWPDESMANTQYGPVAFERWCQLEGERAVANGSAARFEIREFDKGKVGLIVWKTW